MTIDEFNITRWAPNMCAKYNGHIYVIGAVNFKEALVELLIDEDPIWVRCENMSIA